MNLDINVMTDRHEALCTKSTMLIKTGILTSKGKNRIDSNPHIYLKHHEYFHHFLDSVFWRLHHQNQYRLFYLKQTSETKNNNGYLQMKLEKKKRGKRRRHQILPIKGRHFCQHATSKLHNPPNVLFDATWFTASDMVYTQFL